jgi:hypothetical protein
MPFQLDYGIPLSGRAPQVQDPMQAIAGMAQVRAMQENNRALAEQRQASAEQRRTQTEMLRRQEAQSTALRGLKTFTPETVFPIVGPVEGAKILDGLAALNDKELKRFKDQREVFATVISGIKASPEPLRPELYQGVVQQFADRGWIDPAKTEAYSPEVLDRYQRELLTPEQQYELDNPKPVVVGGSLMQPRTGAVIATAPETPAAKAAREQAAALTREGHGVTKRGQDMTAATARARLTAEGAGAASPMTPEGLQVAAWQYIQTGAMPPLGMGKQAADARMRILNEAGKVASAGGGDPVLNAALYKADSGALKQQQATLSAITAFENTAKKNLEVMEREAKRIVDFGGPWLNKPMRAAATGLGSTKMAAFNAAHAAVVPEIARILTQPNLSGVLSDSARHEINAMLDADASIPQMLSAIRILKTDMNTRRSSIEHELEALQRRIGGRGPAGRSAGAAPGAGGSVSMVTPDGRPIVVPANEVAEAEKLGARRQ